MKLPPHLRWLWLSLAVVFLDRATKAWIESQTSEIWRHELVHNFIYLVHSRNPGIAFSIFANSSSPALRFFLILGALAIMGIIAYLLVANSNLTAPSAAGLALLLGGATGNLTDRILHGAVTDFLEVFLGTYRWPAFNVADSAITIGAILLIFDVLFSRQHRTISK
jgi:signal peptidase II